ncbi:MAG: hypothetical protein LBB09_01745 [Rickettsiales bacterium]|nr:hypothetical protein [Rickettsiales bacterium]
MRRGRGAVRRGGDRVDEIRIDAVSEGCLYIIFMRRINALFLRKQQPGRGGGD